jgi:hypothetical protein
VPSARCGRKSVFNASALMAMSALLHLYVIFPLCWPCMA